MAKYKIAWLPGDGIGVDVLEAAKIVLDKVRLDAEYIPGDIGWDFWCREGDAFPPRTIELLKQVDAALFGAITSKPAKTAAAELAPALQNKGLSYRSPIVRMRQLFDLYICLRPCKAYPGNALNFKEGIDLVVYRENTEDLYAGVEFTPVPQELADTLGKLAKPFAPFAKLPLDQYAVSCKINTRAGSERIGKGSNRRLDSAEQPPLSNQNLALPSEMTPAPPPVRLKATYAQRRAFRQTMSSMPKSLPEGGFSAESDWS
jgi:3-isopropylmalate dehydrogenase